jgi:undecaprenyl-diphosphatase
MERLPNGNELVVLAVGCVVAFGVSLLVVRGLMNFVRKRSFASFGVYRVILGVIVIGYYLVEVM